MPGTFHDCWTLSGSQMIFSTFSNPLCIDQDSSESFHAINAIINIRNKIWSPAQVVKTARIKPIPSLASSSLLLKNILYICKLSSYVFIYFTPPNSYGLHAIRFEKSIVLLKLCKIINMLWYIVFLGRNVTHVLELSFFFFKCWQLPKYLQHGNRLIKKAIPLVPLHLTCVCSILQLHFCRCHQLLSVCASFGISIS